MSFTEARSGSFSVRIGAIISALVSHLPLRRALECLGGRVPERVVRTRIISFNQRDERNDQERDSHHLSKTPLLVFSLK